MSNTTGAPRTARKRRGPKTAKERQRAEHWQGTRERLARLVKEKGGAVAFCRAVWASEADPVGANKGKVSKWLSGASNLDPMEARDIAKALGYRAGWLLFGELPEREGLTRASATLYDDVAAYLSAKLADNPAWQRVAELFPTARVDGRKLLASVEGELRSLAESLSDRVDSERALRSLPKGTLDTWHGQIVAKAVRTSEGSVQGIVRADSYLSEPNPFASESLARAIVADDARVLERARVTHPELFAKQDQPKPSTRSKKRV